MENVNTHRRDRDDIGSYVKAQECAEAKIRTLLEGRDGEVFTITQSRSVFEALEAMSDHGIGALVVVEDGRVVGMISERDYARKVILIGRSSRETTVREIMSWPARTVTPEQTVAECMALMTEYRIRHLPVLEAGGLVGIVSLGDLVKSIIADQGHRLEQYEKYISGSYPT
jgi:CBS domain-containing protein